MAGQKATIDKDTSSYLSKSSRPESERETAYHTQKGIEGPDFSDDRNGNDDDVFKSTAKARQGRRKADQSSAGTTGIGDTGTGLEKMESSSPFRKVLMNRFGLSESENPGVAASPSTSDNPSLGMYSVNNSDFRQQKPDVRGMLEAIALQAAETFEALDENKNVPEALSSELDQCSKVIDKLYEYVTNNDNQLGNPNNNSSPVENDPATMPVKRESVEMNESKSGETYASTTHSPTAVKSKKKYRIKAESIDGEKFISEKLTKKECKCAMQEMLDSGAYAMIEAVKLSPKQKKIAGIAGDPHKIDSDDLAALRAKRKMQEAVIGVFDHLISE